MSTSVIETCTMLQLPPEAIALASGELLMRGYTPATLVGPNPPALIPLVRSSSGIILGYWKHWFQPCRKLTIVEHFGTTMFGRYRITTEHARTIEQMFYIYLLRQIVRDDGIEPESIAFAHTIGLADVDLLEMIANETGDDLQGLLRLPCFRADPPHSCFDSDAEYPGDFPHPGFEINQASLSASCGYEIHSRFRDGVPDPANYREQIAKMATAPMWLRVTEQANVFDELLAKNDLAGAWMSLNSLGWDVKNAIEAIRRLAIQANIDDFTRFAQWWIKTTSVYLSASY